MSAKIVIISLIIFGVIAWGGLSVGKRIGGSSTISSNGITLVQAKPGYKEFNIVMDQNRYNPSAITVNQGDQVVINLRNNDFVGHAVEIARFNATIPGVHLPVVGTAVLDFIATSKVSIDAATCGGARPEDKTDAHGEELIINVI